MLENKLHKKGGFGFMTGVMNNFSKIFKNNRQFAFTLAEFLIALAIIGIVAAITLPVLYNKIQKDTTVNRLKKVYSELQQAVRLSQAENGDIGSWDSNLDNHILFETYIKPFLGIISEEQFNSDGSNNHNIVYKGVNNQKLSTSTMFKTPSHLYNLKSGSQLIIIHSNGVKSDWRRTAERYGSAVFAFDLAVDLNGYKKPNKLGKDIFMFELSPKYGIVPSGFINSGDCNYVKQPNTDINVLKTGSGIAYSYCPSCCKQRACNKNSFGYYCTALIIVQGWKISKDYPW